MYWPDTTRRYLQQLSVATEIPCWQHFAKIEVVTILLQISLIENIL